MSALTRALKDIVSVKLKTRHDGYCDQFNRILMVKLLLVSSVVMSVDYFADSVNCMIPKDSKHRKEFFSAACWISGFYIYEEMKTRMDESGYHGIPSRVDYDGINRRTNKLCITNDLYEKNEDCIAMTRKYYLHYQWMPVYIASLGIFFYLPYVMFRIANSDLIDLKKRVKSKKGNVTENIIKTYFNHSVNTICFLRLRIIWNLTVKLLYIVASIAAFSITDSFLNGDYAWYGTDYLNWSELNNTNKFISVKKKVRGHSGNMLLPSMGFCDVHEASYDIRNTFHNHNRFICEISPHTLYQYVLVMLWFCFVASNLIAVLGLFIYLITNMYYLVCYCGALTPKRKLYHLLTLREIEYLEYIKSRDLTQYGALLRELKHQKLISDPHFPHKNFEILTELERYIASLNA